MWASSCPLPPRAHPSESYQNSLAVWTAFSLRCSYRRPHAHSASVCERYFLLGSACPLAMGSSSRVRGRRGGSVLSNSRPLEWSEPLHKDIQAYNAAQPDRATCKALANAIDRHLPGAESKIWHRHPVWFLEGNPIVGYSTLKGG